MWRPRRRERYGNLAPEHQMEQVWDDLDGLDDRMAGIVERFTISIDHLTEAFQKAQLSEAANRNRMLGTVIFSLIAVLASILVPLVTR